MGKEGDDYTGKTLTQKCCAAGSTAAQCPELNNAAYTCSNVYTDRTLAKSICPFRQTTCGPKQAYEFYAYGFLSSRENVTISLNTGETCPFMVQTLCGIPTVAPSNTLGFDIETVDYNSDEVPSLRFL